MILPFEQTYLETWFERDRAHVALMDLRDESTTLVEWWDEDVWQAIEDGFLSDKGFVLGRMLRTRELHESAYEYAQTHGMLPEVRQ
jgi:hypothetical protein